MSYYSPRFSAQFRLATGGTGLEALMGGTGVQVETSVGHAETQGILSERETFRVSAGEQSIRIIPVNERVIVTHTSAPATGGLVDFEQPSIDFGLGLFGITDAVDTNFIQNFNAQVQAQQQAEAAYREFIQAVNYQIQLEADIAAGLQSGALVATGPLDDPNTQIIPAPPPPPFESGGGGGFGGGSSEAPITAPPGGSSQEQLPAGGCQTILVMLFDGNVEVPVFQHFNGSGWEMI